MGKIGLLLNSNLRADCEFNIEWHSIVSGGKPTFPTCEFPSLEWYPLTILIFHNFPGGI
jgi:hypothetical protein